MIKLISRMIKRLMHGSRFCKVCKSELILNSETVTSKHIRNDFVPDHDEIRCIYVKCNYNNMWIV